MSGTLTLCATPIGNMEDITLRVLRILKEADLIAAEDTRNSQKLLNYYDIHTKMTSYHEHNKWDKGRALVEKLKEGNNIALITDAGMPGISDPGYELAKMCIEEGINVTVAPGASAVLCALALSALPTRRFVFEGFLPQENKDRKKRLEKLQNEERTMAFYEAPHRLTKTLAELKEVFGEDRRCAVIREISKKHESALRVTVSEALEYYTQNAPKGECVIIVDGKDEQENIREEHAAWDELTVKEHYDMYIAAGMDRKDAMKQVAKDRGVQKREIYKLLLE